MDKTIFGRVLTVKKSACLLLAAVMLVNMASIAFAGTGSATTQDVANRISCVLCKLANLIFMTAGAIASLVIVMAGVRWVTSADDPGARNAAKTTIISAFVGLIIIVIAVFIVALVVDGLLPGDINPQDWIMEGCDTLCSGFRGT